MRSLAWVLCLAAACRGEDDEKREIAGFVAGLAKKKRVPRCEEVIAVSKIRSVLKKVVKTTLLFPDTDALWDTKRIAVCWENPNPANPFDQRRREQIRAAVARTWEAASHVRFTGWEQCPQSYFAGIRIQIEDTAEGSYTVGLGDRLKGMPAGMVLNFTMKNWRPKCGTSDACFEQVAVHEFGHALAFAHEQNRPDEPDKECRETAQGHDGTCTFCAADHQSIMSYCLPNWSNGGELSECDKGSVGELYSAP